MSVSEIIEELPKLTAAERHAVREKLLELAIGPAGIELTAHGISENQAADLRTRLAAFAEDWSEPAMDIYDVR